VKDADHRPKPQEHPPSIRTAAGEVSGRVAGLTKVYMVRPTLDDLPKLQLPPPFALRGHRPGDVAHWVRIQATADPFHQFSPEVFREQFGSDVSLWESRQVFLCDIEGTPVGTSTAWFNPDYRGGAWGRVHWLAITPAWQGRGLSKALLAETCRRLRQLGHDRAYLVTETVRVAAIRLYMKFGFRPEVRDQADMAAWENLKQAGLPI
jgi:GNAT superfamily N-acetyltransferase